MKKLAAILSLFFYSIAFGQTTPVIGTVTDTDGSVWTNATATVQFMVNPSVPNINSYTLAGQPLTGATYSSFLTQNITANGSGQFSVTLLDNNLISPSGSRWYFVIKSNTSAPAVAYVPIQVTGSTTVNLSSFFSGGSIPPRFPAYGGYQYGYADVEITPIPNPGGFYYNTTGNTQRIWSGLAWSNQGSSGATGTVTSVAFPTTLGNLFTCTVANPTTAAAISCTFTTQAALCVYGNFTASAATPTCTAAPAFSAANLTNYPTFNQSTTGTSSGITNNANPHKFFGNNAGSAQQGAYVSLGTQDTSANWVVTDSGTADAYVGSAFPAPIALVDGLEIFLRTANTNLTTTPTFNLNSLGAKTIVNAHGINPGDITSGFWMDVIYNATTTQWELQNPAMAGSNYWRGVLGAATVNSGGVICATSSTVAAYSAALVSGQFVLGGGAGACPSTSFSLVPANKGGTGLDTSSSTGFLKLTSGSWSVVSAVQTVFTTALTGATPVAAVTSSTIPATDINTLLLSANVTSFTLPASTAVANSELLKIIVQQSATGGPFTLPTGTASSPFTAGTGTTLINSIPGGCPTIGTTQSSTVPSGIIYSLQYYSSITSWIIVGCQGFNPAATGVLEFAINGNFIGNAAVGAVVAAATANKAGHFVSLGVVNQNGGTCTTAPQVNIYDGTTNTGTAIGASSTTQAKGSIATNAQTLTFAAGDNIGIYVSTAGATCTSTVFIVTAEVVEP